jgi:hypothetical protein
MFHCRKWLLHYRDNLSQLSAHQRKADSTETIRVIESSDDIVFIVAFHGLRLGDIQYE